MPGSFPMSASGKPFTLHDLVADSIANFHLGQEEIEWTALTYISWLPPERQWTNKFGETFTFDQLATELMRRRFEEATCVGSHVVQAMVVLLRVDREVCSVLSQDVRTIMVKRLRDIVRVAEALNFRTGVGDPIGTRNSEMEVTTSGNRCTG